ncbi:hypothetical protein SFUMM280S_03252 [Streptomyces fumanus]
MWSAAGSVAVTVTAVGRWPRGVVSLRARWPVRGPAGSAGCGRRPVSRPDVAGPAGQRTWGRNGDGGAAVASGPDARRRRTDPHVRGPAPCGQDTLQTPLRPPSDLCTRSGSARTPVSHVVRVKNALRHSSSGPSALTVFTLGHRKATPRDRRGWPFSNPPMTACIPPFHTQTRGVAEKSARVQTPRVPPPRAAVRVARRPPEGPPTRPDRGIDSAAVRRRLPCPGRSLPTGARAAEPLRVAPGGGADSGPDGRLLVNERFTARCWGTVTGNGRIPRRTRLPANQRRLSGSCRYTYPHPPTFARFPAARRCQRTRIFFRQMM